MNISILLCIIAATVVTTIINFVKPAYTKVIAKKREQMISVGLSLILGVVAAFAIYPRIEWELNTPAILLGGLAIGTGATLFYDLWKIIQNFGSSKPIPVEEKESGFIGFCLDDGECADLEEEYDEPTVLTKKTKKK